jgi:hypothetical protein
MLKKKGLDFTHQKNSNEMKKNKVQFIYKIKKITKITRTMVRHGFSSL